MRIAVVGVGAVGGYFGGRLAERWRQQPRNQGAQTCFCSQPDTMLFL